MRAPTGWLLADSASDTGVHYGWPDDDDDDVVVVDDEHDLSHDCQEDARD